MKKKKRWPALLVLFIMFVLIGAYVYMAYQMVKPEEDKICDGVYIESINLSGMTREQAEKEVERYVREKTNRTLRVDVNGKKVETSLADLEYACEDNDFIEQALHIGKDSNPFTNYVVIKETEKNPVQYHLSFGFSEEKIRTFLKKKCNKKCTKAKNAEITMENGVLVYGEAEEGITIDVDTTLQLVKEALEKKEEECIDVVAQVTVQEPMVTQEMASRCKDKIGSFQTVFNAGNVSRSKNLANAARLINGTVIYPGETFSVHDTISPLTEENGYYAAPSYNNGKVEDSIGGGVCQVSTTLYNAVLRAELEIVERSPHSMVVSYVPPSMDAAIAGDYKDFKFRNNTEVPIYLEGGTYSGTIYFHVYGEETRSEQREISFKSETIETIQPGEDKVIYDSTKPAGYVQVTQEAHTGYRAVLWKIVKQNGKTKKTQVNSSTYQAVPRYVTKGSMNAEPKNTADPGATATPKAKETAVPKKPVKKPVKKPKATPVSKPKVTAAPTREPVVTTPEQEAEEE